MRMIELAALIKELYFGDSLTTTVTSATKLIHKIRTGEDGQPIFLGLLYHNDIVHFVVFSISCSRLVINQN